MPPLTIVSADAALKQIYKPGYMNDVVYKDRPLLALLPKSENFGGRNMPVVLEYGHPAGRSQVFATAQTNATPALYEDFLLTRVHDYGVTQIDGETADAIDQLITPDAYLLDAFVDDSAPASLYFYRLRLADCDGVEGPR